jgi:hypothetical protein
MPGSNFIPAKCQRARTQKLLARLYIKPHTMRVEPDSAIASGDVGWVRIIGANGRAVADSVVSTKDGPGWITFNTLAFRKRRSAIAAREERTASIPI